jgi:hypothetical protein
MQTAQEIEQLRKVLGDKFPADLEDILQKLANKPADSDSDVSASAKSVEVESPAVELPRLSSKEDQLRESIRTAPRTIESYRRKLDEVMRHAPANAGLHAELAAHFGTLAKAIESVIPKKIHTWHPSSMPSVNYFQKNLSKNPKWSLERIVDYSQGALLSQVHEQDKEAFSDMVSVYASTRGFDKVEKVKDKPKSVLRRSDYYCKIEPAIARAATLAGNDAEIQAHAIARQYDSDKQNGQGWIALDDLKELLAKFGIGEGKNFYRLLKSVEKAGFWELREKHGIKRVFIWSPRKIGTLVLSRLSDEQLEDFHGNQLPGSGREIWVDCSCGRQEFRGRLMDAWFEQRSEEGVKISNARLAQLWGVTPKTILNRRKRVGLTGTANYADGDASIAPAHAVEGDSGKMKWQMVNTYVATSETRRHSHVGQQSKVRKAAKIFIKDRGNNPAVEGAGGIVVQRYFDGKTPVEAEKLARKAITKERADDIIYIYQKTQRFSRRSYHERYTSMEAYSA